MNNVTSVVEATPTKPQNFKYYLIKQRGKVVAEVYGTYSEARSVVRSRIRRSVKKGRTMKRSDYDFDSISRNPSSIKAYGYRIVAA